MTSGVSEAQAVAAADWAGERGRKWVEHLGATEVMLAPVDEPLIDALSLAGARRVADIGCGGGRTSRAVATRLPRDAWVHGIDISPDVIDVARAAAMDPGAASAAAGRQGARLEFHCADAGGTAPPGALYDRLTSRFGVMFFDDPPAALANLASWLEPGGRFAFAVWAALADNPWMLTLRTVVAEEVDVPPPLPDSPGPFRYADAARFCGVLEAAGFRDVTAGAWRGEVMPGGGVPAERSAAFCLSAFSVGELLGHDDARVRRVRARLTELLKESEVNGVVQMPAAVHIVSGGR